MQKIRLQPGQTIGFKLTSVERELLVQAVPFPDAALEDKLKSADAGASNVNLTLPELRGLATCIQAQIKRTQRDRKLGVKLNRIWQRIVDVQKVFLAVFLLVLLMAAVLARRLHLWK